MGQDKERADELKNRLSAIQGRTAVDQQQANDFAHQARVIADEE